MRALVALVLLASSPASADAKFHVIASTAQVADPGDKVTLAAVDTALGTLRDRLDACVHGKLRALAWITLEKSKVVAVDVAGSSDRAAETCLAGELKKLAVLDAVGRTAVVVAISASPPTPPAPSGQKPDPFADRSLSRIDVVTSSGMGVGGGGTAEGDVCASPSCTRGHGAGARPSPATVDVFQGGVQTGALTQDDISRVIRARAGILKACYLKELEKSPKLAGKVVVEFTIRGDGTVANTKVSESTLKSEPVESCVLRVFAGLKFPPKASETTVKYPLVMSSQ